LQTSVEFLKGIGSFKAELLRKELHISTYGDLLHYFPYRYIDGTQVQNIQSLQPDQEWVQLKGIIMNFNEHGSGFKKRLTATLYDQTGQLELVWFQGISYVQKNILPNTAYSIFGKLTFFNGFPTITHPEIEAIKPGQNNAAPTMQPAYSVTEKLRSKGLNNRSFAKVTQAMLEKIRPGDIYETLPPNILQQYNLCGRYEALSQIHFPQNAMAQQRSSHRLKWEELLIAQLKITRANIRNHQQPGYVFGSVGDLFNTFYNDYLPFDLTGAQKRVIKEIRTDTLQGRQMNRLVQGDVGSGKTMVALLSMLIAADNGYQSCMMAPTEILAQQHFQGISDLLKDMPVSIAILTGSVKTKERRRILEGLKEGTIHIVVGTHALVEDKVTFRNLGLAVIDEQHRFGVSQRAKLWQKNTLPPHVLVMTATPIPRTLAMTLYGDLDVSVIDELPPGRKPIHTTHRFDVYRFKIMEFIKYEIEKGRQIYIVYPLIDESDKLDYESLIANYEQVKTYFPDPKYNVAMVHGRQPADEKDRNMQRFVSGEAHILVSTTVIEVGVNVPNASVMLIESAERFGLSQLHQLRGRVGRGSEKSYCILLTGQEISKESRQRMSIMTQTNDGFLIAEEDLKMRGPGDIYGTRQSGALDFKIADIVQDAALVEETKKAAELILSEDPGLTHPNHRMLYQALHHNTQSNTLQWNKIS
jgi:ATP-dependent DNA helicase RecG